MWLAYFSAFTWVSFFREENRPGVVELRGRIHCTQPTSALLVLCWEILECRPARCAVGPSWSPQSSHNGSHQSRPIGPGVCELPYIFLISVQGTIERIIWRLDEWADEPAAVLVLLRYVKISRLQKLSLQFKTIICQAWRPSFRARLCFNKWLRWRMGGCNLLLKLLCIACTSA